MEAPADTSTLYVGLVTLVALARLGELARSRRNLRRLRARGGVESGSSHYPYLVAVHAGILVACPLEVLILRRPFLPALGVPMLVFLVATFALRYWVIATLGERWCTRVVILPDAPLVATGPYRFMRHPNYLAVAIEIPALPLVHSAWISALVFGGANVAVLRERIRVEETALRRLAPPRKDTP